jgi:hypothetical protein
VFGLHEFIRAPQKPMSLAGQPQIKTLPTIVMYVNRYFPLSQPSLAINFNAGQDRAKGQFSAAKRYGIDRQTGL